MIHKPQRSRDRSRLGYTPSEEDISTIYKTLYTATQTSPDNDLVYITSSGFLQFGLNLGRNSQLFVQGYSRNVTNISDGASVMDVNLTSTGIVEWFFLGGNQNHITNAGVISSPANAIRFSSFGLLFDGGKNYITNTGLIGGPGSYDGTAFVILAEGPSATVIDNSGTISSASDDAIKLGAGDDVIYNSGTIKGDIDLGGGNNRFIGTTGSLFGTITAGAGADRIWGGAGDDLISSGGGAGVVHGRGGDDALNGGAIQDILYGEEGSDILDSGDADSINTLYGGAGDGLYYIHSTLDLISERAYGGSGIDGVVVIGAFDFSLSDRVHIKGDVEDLTLSGLTGQENINGTGNALDNKILGTSGGSNILSGLGGDDDMDGRAGNDTLIGGAGADFLKGGLGTDIASYETSQTSVTVALDGSLAATGDALGDTFYSVEGLRGANVAGAGDILRLNISGNAISGLLGDDTLDGGSSADKLNGGAGSDTLIGGAGSDWFIYAAPDEGGDTINDFISGTDTFHIQGAAFVFGLTAATYSSANFVSGDSNLAASDNNDYFIFNTTDQTLWFDPDGYIDFGTDLAPILIAHLQAGATVVFSDIVIF